MQNSLLQENQQKANYQRRLHEVLAREHLGAVGLAQTSVLENILRAGKEGLAATDTLHQVVRITTDQIRTIPFSEVGNQKDEQLSALNEIVQNGKEQLTAAQALEGMIIQALSEITNTPMDEISVRRLNDIYQSVKEQCGALNTIISAAHDHADTLEQVVKLEKLSALHKQRLNEIQCFSSKQEVISLGNAGEEIITRIAELDEAHGEQVDALKQIGEAVICSFSDTGATTEKQVEALDELARAAKSRADTLRETQSSAQY